MATKQLQNRAQEWPVPMEGGCGCSALRYRLNRSPMIIHCCNCEACQRETGSAFALNVVVEADAVELLPGSRKRSAESNNDDERVAKPKLTLMPSHSGQGQLIARCPICFVAVWSHCTYTGEQLGNSNHVDAMWYPNTSELTLYFIHVSILDTC